MGELAYVIPLVHVLPGQGWWVKLERTEGGETKTQTVPVVLWRVSYSKKGEGDVHELTGEYEAMIVVHVGEDGRDHLFDARGVAGFVGFLAPPQLGTGLEPASADVLWGGEAGTLRVEGKCAGPPKDTPLAVAETAREE